MDCSCDPLFFETDCHCNGLDSSKHVTPDPCYEAETLIAERPATKYNNNNNNNDNSVIYKLLNLV